MERRIVGIIKRYQKENDVRLLCIAGGPGVGKSYIAGEVCGKDTKIIDNINSEDLLLKERDKIIRLINAGKRVIVVGRLSCKVTYDRLFGDEMDMGFFRVGAMSFSEFCFNVKSYDSRELLKLYMTVGGLPKCVKIFMNTGDLKAVRKQQKQICRRVIDEMSKSNYAYRDKLIKLITGIAIQAYEESTGFNYRKINRNARERDYIKAINDLENNGIVYRMGRLGENNPASSRNYRLFLYDMGISCALMEITERDIFEGNIFESEYFKYIIVGQEIMNMDTQGECKLGYWGRNRAKAKISLIVEKEEKNSSHMYALQFRSNNNMGKAMTSFLKDYPKAMPVEVIIDKAVEYSMKKARR